jgi:hypothetical protein
MICPEIGPNAAEVYCSRCRIRTYRGHDRLTIAIFKGWEHYVTEKYKRR